jgi:DNA repair photolyase
MTKSALVLRDVDLWKRLGDENAGRVTITLVTLDDELAKKLEPRAASPVRRLHVLRELVKAKVPVSVNIAPVIPGLTDTELPTIMQAIADAGATRASWVLLRLPYQVKDLFLDWLQRNVHPSRATHVESLIRQSRGGKLYSARAGQAWARQGKDRRAAVADFRCLQPQVRPQSRRPPAEHQSLPPAAHRWADDAVLIPSVDVNPLSRRHFLAALAAAGVSSQFADTPSQLNPRRTS